LYFWQDDTESVKYVQISAESYARLMELEDQVKILNEKLSNLNDKLSSAQSEMVTKDNLVKQHAKVAEEAVSGMIMWIISYICQILFVNSSTFLRNFEDFLILRSFFV